jgi:hypothetical protein
MHNFDLILEKINLKNNIYYKSYYINNDKLVLEVSSYSGSTVYNIQELVEISNLVKEYNYNCFLLENNNIEITSK